MPSYSLAELSKLTGAQLIGNPDQIITGIDALETAGSSDISFLANLRYTLRLRTTKAGAVCIDPKTPFLENKNYLVTENPSEIFQTIAKLLCRPPSSTGFLGIHPTAVIHESAQIDKEVTIGPYVAVDQNAKIQKGTIIGPHVFIGAFVQIGENCTLHAHSVVREDCILGNRVILQPGAIIGSCGFGYITDAEGKHSKLEQLGYVILEDDVEIGSNTTIDRARFKATKISNGTKIDNLVQIGHNVSIGPRNIIVSQTGIAGSTHTGCNVVIGGQAGLVGHIKIADRVQIATRGGVSKDIEESGPYGGGPVLPLAEHNRMQVHLRKIEEYAKRIKELEKNLKEYARHIKELEKKLNDQNLLSRDSSS